MLYASSVASMFLTVTCTVAFSCDRAVAFASVRQIPSVALRMTVIR
jgi:hypothetical protein